LSEFEMQGTEAEDQFRYHGLDMFARLLSGLMALDIMELISIPVARER